MKAYDLYQYIRRAISRLLCLPFAVCVLFLHMLGKCFGIGYKKISVIFNLWMQGAILLLSGCLPFIAAIYRCIVKFNWMNSVILLFSSIYLTIYVSFIYWLVNHYRGNIDAMFDRCVIDLNKVARNWHVSYHAVNLIIFVMWWLTVIGFNCFVAYYIIDL